jgi:hypothetical protein
MINSNSIWKPLWGPLTDWPLAICDVESVDRADLIASDVVTRTGFTENALVYYNPEHEWYYLNGQMPSELVIFRQSDTEAASQIGKMPFSFSRQMAFTDTRIFAGVIHSGFQIPRSDSNERPRESIETRVMIYY